MVLIDPIIVAFENYIYQNTKYSLYVNTEAFTRCYNASYPKCQRTKFPEVNAFFISLTNSIEELIKDKVKNHSVWFLMYFFRSINYALFSNLFKRQSTCNLVRDTIDCFVVKYGASEIGDMDLYSRVAVPNCSGDDFEKMLDIIILSYIYNATTAGYRIYNKTRKIKFGKLDYELAKDKFQQRMMDLVDTRQELCGDIFHSLRSPEYYFSSSEQTHDFLVGNKETKKISKYLLFSLCYLPQKEEAGHTFAIIPFFIDGIISSVRFWTDMNIKVKGYSPDLLISILTCITLRYIDYYMLGKNEMNFKHMLFEQLQNRAYSLTSEDVLVDSILLILPEVHWNIWGIKISDEELKNHIHKFIDVFSDNSDIDPFTRSGLPIFIRQQNKIMIDFLHLLRPLAYWSDSLSEARRGSVGSNRGQRFQEEVRRMIREYKFKRNVKIFPEGSENVYIDGKCVAEIDIGVLVDETYYVIECKFKFSGRVNISGDLKTERNNWNYQKKWLSQVDTLTDFILEGAKLKDGNPLLPLQTKYVLPLVCTCEPMYVFQPEETYFANEDTPRVLTPIELLQVLASNDANNFNLRKVQSTSI